jgi:hypothetical protein
MLSLFVQSLNRLFVAPSSLLTDTQTPIFCTKSMRMLPNSCPNLGKPLFPLWAYSALGIIPLHVCPENSSNWTYFTTLNQSGRAILFGSILMRSLLFPGASKQTWRFANSSACQDFWLDKSPSYYGPIPFREKYLTRPF